MSEQINALYEALPKEPNDKLAELFKTHARWTEMARLKAQIAQYEAAAPLSARDMAQYFDVCDQYLEIYDQLMPDPSIIPAREEEP